jgi:hypothetical protein
VRYKIIRMRPSMPLSAIELDMLLCPKGLDELVDIEPLSSRYLIEEEEPATERRPELTYALAARMNEFPEMGSYK